MNAYTKMSEKGQVVVPKPVRDRLGWLPGTNLDVLETFDGVILRRRSEARQTITVEEAIDRFKRLYQHKGSPVPVEQLGWSIDVNDPNL